MISAHYGLSDVFDNLVISLCKFTTLLSAPEVRIFNLLHDRFNAEETTQIVLVHLNS